MIWSAMRYDLDFLSEYCREIGLVSRIVAPSTLEVFLGDNAILCFQNAEHEQDCLMGFLGTPWHTHDNLMFCGSWGYYIELDTLNILSGIVGGSVLVCERYADGTLADRWLIHSEYNNEFRHLQPGERIIVRRANLAVLA